MIHGLDTGFLVAAEVVEHAEHAAARATLSRLISGGDRLALAPQVLAEFLHVVTDSRRFSQPLSMSAALQIAERWWMARDVQQVFVDDVATRHFLSWMLEHKLGRKRLVDTLLAATYWRAGVTPILTTNAADFGVFGEFSCMTPVSTAPRTNSASPQN